MGVFIRKKEPIPTVKDTVKELLSDASGCGYLVEAIHDDDRLTDLHMDSLDKVCLIMECESHFNIHINDEDPELDNILQYGTVKDFSDYITKLRESC